MTLFFLAALIGGSTIVFTPKHHYNAIILPILLITLFLAFSAGYFILSAFLGILYIARFLLSLIGVKKKELQNANHKRRHF
jgi:predicted membrane protein